jgi:3alpha(or 20beta)-hydroxysteroid dehydrogenase
MTRTAAKEVAQFGVRVNSIHPGIIETDMVQGLHDMGLMSAVMVRIPAGRTAQAVEVARLALYLASDDSAYSTGSEFIIDGGMTA